MPPSPNKTKIVLDLPEIAPPKPSRLRAVWPLLFLLVVLAAAILLALNKQNLQDWRKLRGYQPPAAVAHLADQDTMNAYTQHLFYLNKPQLLSTVASFRRYCPENKDTIVLGCYHSGQNGIFIYAVQDADLAGIQQVTAAHEVLHAVYARLSTKERTQLNSQLEDFYKHGLINPRVLAEVKIYQKTEPGDVMDEMSCTFGTEIAQLPAPLEAYYQRYFTHRAAIVAYEQQYEGAFTTKQNAITADDKQLASLKAQITAQQAALSYQLSQLNSDHAKLQSLQASAQTAAFNAAVPGYNNEINTYNAGVDALRGIVTSYNQLVSARNLIAGQLTTLDSAIDTRQIPQMAH